MDMKFSSFFSSRHINILLQVKYNGCFAGNLSFFWKYIDKLMPFMRLDMRKMVGVGKNIIF
jgi:hypothetical protein